MADDQKYLSAEDEARFARYLKYQYLFQGSHRSAFAASLNAKFTAEELKTYISCNFAGLISKVAADFLFGEPVIVEAPDDASDDQKDNIAKIIENNNLHTLNWETSLVTSYKGDALYKVRLGDLAQVGIKDNKEMGAIIEFVQPDIYIPVLDPDNANIVKEMTLAWKKRIGSDDYLRKERHFPNGRILNELWKVKGNRLDGQINLAKIYDNPPAEEEWTGIEGFSIFHIPNFRSSPAHHFGQSDYEDIHSLIEEVNDRMSGNSRILTKHSDPKLAVPPGVLDENGNVRRENLEMFEVSSNDSGIVKPEYITWDGKLDESFKQIDKLMEFLFMITETSPGVLGVDSGGMAESGRALKFKMLRTIAKIKRKKVYFEEVLKKALLVAQEFEALAENSADRGPEPIKVDVIFQDGLPTDFREEAEIREIELNSGALSDETAVRERNPNWAEDEIQKELERLKSNTPDFGATAPAGIPPMDPEEPSVE